MFVCGSCRLCRAAPAAADQNRPCAQQSWRGRPIVGLYPVSSLPIELYVLTRLERTLSTDYIYCAARMPPRCSYTVTTAFVVRIQTRHAVAKWTVVPRRAPVALHCGRSRPCGRLPTLFRAGDHAVTEQRSQLHRYSCQHRGRRRKERRLCGVRKGFLRSHHVQEVNVNISNALRCLLLVLQTSPSET